MRTRDVNTSPPRTPQATTSRSSRGNASAASRALRGAPRETFLDDITPVDFAQSRNGHRDDDGRHSHDLSIAPEQVTRYSLVDNMLLSLDQLSFGGDTVFGMSADDARLYSSFADEDNYSSYSPQRINSRPSHGHSFSSDFDNHDAASRGSSQYTRTRRSNSSSNFTTTNGRVNHGNGAGSIGTQRPSQVQSRGLYSHSGKGSKGSSSTASFDLGYAQVTGNQRWAQGFGTRGRSSSFDDYGHDNHIMNLQRQQAHSPTELEPFDGYEAAPTPTIPVGPRRQRPVSPGARFMAESASQSPKSQMLERKRSKSTYTKRAETSHGPGGTIPDHNRKLPPLPAFMKEEPAPSPLVAYNKAKDGIPAPANVSKPGFFRRVFGAKTNLAAAVAGPNSSHGSTTSVENSERPGSNKHMNAERSKTSHGHPSPQPPPIPKDQPHVITKKPSSFFRRRKKSVSEPEVPSLPPSAPALLFHPDRNQVGIITDVSSPTSSLLQVMKPYLNSPTIPSTSRVGYDTPSRYPNDSADEDADDLKGFSPGYNPDKNATIRSVNSGRRDGRAASGMLPRSGLSQSHLGPDAGEDSDRTFLQDSSDNDKDGGKIVPQTLTVKKDTSGRDGPHSPASVARDMALVAEYEQKYSKRAPAKKKENPMLSLYPKTQTSPKSPKSIDRERSPSPEYEELVRLSPTGSGKQKENPSRLQQNISEEDLSKTSNLSLPLEGPKYIESSQSTPTVFYSATSLPIFNVEDSNDGPPTTPRSPLAMDSTNEADSAKPVDIKEPTVGDRERAKKIYDGNEDFIQQAKAAAWLGEEGAVRQRTLVAYMELYDFKDLNILAALRALCNRLVLRAESQQVDRILDTFAGRWCECNPNHGFKITDVVHTICYSILLLNTDLHLADIDSKMTRSQFVKNTVPTILRVIEDAAPDAFEPNRPTVLAPKFQSLEPESMASDSLGDNLRVSRDSFDNEKPSWRLSMRPGMPTALRANSDGPAPTPLNYATPMDDCGPLVKAPFHGTLRTWEVQVEIVLKDFYNSIRADRLPLFGAPAEQPKLQQPSQSSLSVFATGMLRRTPSVISKAGSESQSFTRGRTADTAVRLNTGKWSNKNRSRPRVYPHSTMGSSRTSLDDGSSIWSPSQSSSTWSKYSLGKTHTSMSVNSLDSNYPQGDYQQSIGFANALSQAIIREEHIGSPVSSAQSDDLRTAPLLDDESLELAGAPWAKEGIVKHKHHLDAASKRAKERSWTEVFAVVEKGYMTLFSFSSNSKSQRQKTKAKGAGGGVVGGGNWQDNAENLGSFLLRQTIASALPSPGYSKARPHVFALSLPTGAVHLFQVGTPEIVREWVATANYWSARLSNHPLVGGISNIEYGWGESVINNSLVSAINEAHPPSTAMSGPPGSQTSPGRASISAARPSLQGSLRSSLDHAGGGTFRARLPGDKVTISEWSPPTQSMRASGLGEEEQLRALEEYVRGVEEELDRHNQLRGGMVLAVSVSRPFPFDLLSPSLFFVLE